jgi:hypothetical protein
MKHNKRKKEGGNEEIIKNRKIREETTYDIGKESEGQDKGKRQCRIKMDIKTETEQVK